MNRDSDLASDALLGVILVMLVAVALLAFRIVKLRDWLKEARDDRDSAKEEARHVRTLLTQMENRAECQRRDRENELLQRSREAEREREALEEINTRLRRLVQVDELTGVANAQDLGFAMDKELRRALRSRRPVSLIVVDVDDFRSYNRLCGHDKGDDLLKRITHLAQSVFRRGGDKIGRLGGDRFAVIAPETEYRAALVQAERFRTRVMESSIPVGDPKEGKWVTVSLGVSTLVPDRMVRPYQVFERAVLAMRLAKNRGGNKVSGDRPVGGQDDEGETKRGPVKLYAVSPRSGKGQGQGQGQGE